MSPRPPAKFSASCLPSINLDLTISVTFSSLPISFWSILACVACSFAASPASSIRCSKSELRLASAAIALPRPLAATSESNIAASCSSRTEMLDFSSSSPATCTFKSTILGSATLSSWPSRVLMSFFRASICLEIIFAAEVTDFFVFAEPLSTFSNPSLMSANDRTADDRSTSAPLDA